MGMSIPGIAAVILKQTQKAEGGGNQSPIFFFWGLVISYDWDHSGLWMF